MMDKIEMGLRKVLQCLALIAGISLFVLFQLIPLIGPLMFFVAFVFLDEFVDDYEWVDCTIESIKDSFDDYPAISWTCLIVVIVLQIIVVHKLNGFETFKSIVF